MCFWLVFSDDFLGTTSTSQLSLTPHSDSSAHLPITSTAHSGETLLSPALSPCEEHDSTLSASSISLPTQLEVLPAPATTEIANKLTEATLEDAVQKTQDEQRPEKSDLPQKARVEAAVRPDVAVDVVLRPDSTSKPPENAKEDGPQDLRVFELNSDSGKSTPSNNGKKGHEVFELAVHF